MSGDDLREEAGGKRGLHVWRASDRIWDERDVGTCPKKFRALCVHRGDGEGRERVCAPVLGGRSEQQQGRQEDHIRRGRGHITVGEQGDMGYALRTECA